MCKPRIRDFKCKMQSTLFSFFFLFQAALVCSVVIEITFFMWYYTAAAVLHTFFSVFVPIYPLIGCLISFIKVSFKEQRYWWIFVCIASGRQELKYIILTTWIFSSTPDGFSEGHENYMQEMSNSFPWLPLDWLGKQISANAPAMKLLEPALAVCWHRLEKSMSSIAAKMRHSIGHLHCY